MSKTLLLVDGMYLIFSSFYSNRNMRTLQGIPTGASYGFITRLENLVLELKPDLVTVAFDSKVKSFRHKIFPDYKANRDAPPEELIEQISWIRRYIEARGIDLIEVPGLEADDIIADLSRSHSSGSSVVIFSADKDLFQLVDANVSIYHPKHKQLLDRSGIKEFFGIYPERIVDYLALVGDSSDNIPGVPGIGAKSAAKLLEKYGGIDEILANLESIEERFSKKISENLELLHLSRKLVDLSREYPPVLEFEPNPFDKKIPADVIPLLKDLSFNSLIKRFGLTDATEQRELDVDYRVVRSREELERLAEEVRATGYFSFDVETTELRFYQSQLVGISISFEAGGYYIPFLFPGEDPGDPVTIEWHDFLDVFQPVFSDPTIKKCGHNLKFDSLMLKHNGLDVAGITDDSMILSYLLYPNRRAHNLKDLSFEFLEYKQTEFDELLGKGKAKLSMDRVPLAEISRYCIDDSYLSLKLIRNLKPQVSAKDLDYVYEKIEIPLVQILGNMEYRGVKIDRDFLSRASETVALRIAEVEEEIFAQAGYQFNLNSSQQLGEFLFEKMNLPVTKRTRKTKSYSTDNEVLKELKGFPVVEKVIEFRALRKILSTYLEGLIESLDSEDRVHTSYNQTVTATGRLSSSNPNLQNIPLGVIGGVNVRQAFIAPAGKCLLSADYSQIELRVMAHFSKDQKLVSAFADGLDIHQHTADTVFAGSLFLSPREKRQRAKIINFSILYGSGPYSLSRELGISYREAKDYIDNFFESHSGVRDYIVGVLKQAEASAEVRTISGRRRFLPELQSSNKTVRENGRRMAINTIIQGSAADIIKTAMIRIQNRLAGLASIPIMQVHDELIFETPLEEKDRLIQIVNREMAGAIELLVPLEISVKSGPNWGTMDPV